VFRPYRSGEVLGGFSATSLDEVMEDTHAPSDDYERGDEEIADDVRRELAEDSLTAGLSIHVEVRRGVAVLWGYVSGPEDAEAAEAVASRVPGVVFVSEQLDW
jgi:osmotically-inducible protein OsmY